MSDSPVDVLLVCSLVPSIEQALRARYRVHTLPAGQREQALAKIGPGIRALVTSGGVGADAALIDALPGLQIIAVASEGDDHIHTVADHVFVVPDTIEPLQPLLTVVPLQLLAYHAAVARDCNVDKPRNLAKSVTVE